MNVNLGDRSGPLLPIVWIIQCDCSNHQLAPIREFYMARTLRLRSDGNHAEILHRHAASWRDKHMHCDVHVSLLPPGLHRAV